MPQTPLPLLCALLVGGCTGASIDDVRRSFGPIDPIPGACYARGVTPAVLETVTSQVQEASETRAPDGTVLSPARFRTVTSTRIVEPRGENWFQTPCALRDRDADFVAQVQRALQVRGFYAGEINGFYDVPTRAAVQAFQNLRGLESGTLSTDSAKVLGLVELGRGA
ncbi:MAG: peptidoglycan-binding domain-containing protein [Jannaschia sp.]